MKFEEFFCSLFYNYIQTNWWSHIFFNLETHFQADSNWPEVTKTNRKSFVVDITMMIMVNGMETFAEWLNKNVATQLNND